MNYFTFSSSFRSLLIFQWASASASAKRGRVHVDRWFGHNMGPFRIVEPFLCLSSMFLCLSFCERLRLIAVHFDSDYRRIFIFIWPENVRLFVCLCVWNAVVVVCCCILSFRLVDKCLCSFFFFFVLYFPSVVGVRAMKDFFQTKKLIHRKCLVCLRFYHFTLQTKISRRLFKESNLKSG